MNIISASPSTVSSSFVENQRIPSWAGHTAEHAASLAARSQLGRHQKSSASFSGVRLCLWRRSRRSSTTDDSIGAGRWSADWTSTRSGVLPSVTGF